MSRGRPHFFWLPLVLAQVGTAQADSVNNLLRAEMTRQGIPGLSYTVLRNGKVVRSGALGFASVELRAPARVETVYEIGSLTKQFTGAVALSLVHEGKLKLTDSIVQYLPDAPDTWRPITIQNLIYQTSGLPDYAFVRGIGLTDRFDRATWFRAISAEPIDFAPGAGWAYSNTNYALLGFIIERAAGAPYSQVVTERILRPLKMTSTRFATPNAVVANLATGYQLQERRLLRADAGGLSIPSDGTLLSSVGDLAKWDAALRARRFLPAPVFAGMFSPAALSTGRTRPYGAGWFLSTAGAPGYVGHGGNSSGYSAGIARYDRGALTVIVLTNAYPVGGEALARVVAETINPSLRMTAPKEQRDPNPARTERVKLALAALAENRPDPELLSSEITSTMGTRRNQMSRGFQPFRTITRMGFAGEVPVGQDRQVSYRVFTPGRTFTVILLLTPEDRIAQIVSRPDAVRPPPR